MFFKINCQKKDIKDSFYPKENYYWQLDFYLLDFSLSVTCHFKRGDGNGHHERYGGKFTKEQCVAEAQKQIKKGEKINGKPITGITMRWNCSGKCNCYFEYGMHGSSWQSSSSKWKSCLFRNQSKAKKSKTKNNWLHLNYQL